MVAPTGTKAALPGHTPYPAVFSMHPHILEKLGGCCYHFKGLTSSTALFPPHENPGEQSEGGREVKGWDWVTVA